MEAISDRHTHYWRCIFSLGILLFAAAHHQRGDHKMAITDLFLNSSRLSKYAVAEEPPKKESKTYAKRGSEPVDPKILARNTFLEALDEQIGYLAAKAKGTESEFTVKRPGKGKSAVPLKRFWWEESRGRYFVYLRFGPGALNKERPFIANDFDQVREILSDIKAETEAGLFDDTLLETSNKMKESLAAGRAEKAAKAKLTEAA